MSSESWPSVLAAWAILFSGLTNAHAHVHLCLDGQEPPASVHLAGGNHHAHDHSEHADDDHDDVDVDVPNPAIAKTLKYDDLATLAPLSSWTLSFASPACASPSSDSDAAPRAPPPFSRPLLRAPPL